MVAELRAAGVRAELYLGQSKNMGKQMKYADRRNAPAVVIEALMNAMRGSSGQRSGRG